MDETRLEFGRYLQPLPDEYVRMKNFMEKTEDRGVCSSCVVAVFLVFVLNACLVSASPVPVTTKKLSEVLFYPVRDAPAIAISLNDAHISSEISGIITNIRVRVGDRIGINDVIAELDCRDRELAYKKAEAIYQAALAKKKLDGLLVDKARRLAKDKAIAIEELERRLTDFTVSTTEVDRLNAALITDKHAVERCLIKAPFNAVIIQRIASVGDYVVAGTNIVRILDEEDIEISAKVQEQDLETLRKSEKLAFISQNRSYPVRLRSILPLMDSRLKSYEVRLAFIKLKSSPGSSGRISWEIPTAHVPAPLVVKRNHLGIFVEIDGKASFVVLDNAKEGQPAAIDIPTSTNIIIDGRYGVENGDTVQVVQP